MKQYLKILEAARLFQVHGPLAQIHSRECDPMPPYSIIQSPAITRATLTNKRCADTLKKTIEEHTDQTGEYFNVLTLCFPDSENAALVTFVGEEGRRSFKHIYHRPDQINDRNYILLFLENNPLFEDFEKIPLTPTSWSWSDSVIPIYSA